MKIRILKQLWVERVVHKNLNFLLFGATTQIENKYLESLEVSGSAWSSYILTKGKANKKPNNGHIRMFVHDIRIDESKH